MTETLFIRLGSQVNDDIQWLILGVDKQEIIASGELKNAEQLADLTEKAQQRQVIVFVSSCDVMLKSLTVPAKSQRAMQLATPYMLEDELAQDVDNLFFAYANLPENEKGNNCFTAVVEKAQMKEWISWLSRADISVKTIIPDVLAMPLLENKSSVISFPNGSNEQIVLRQGIWQGYTVDENTWQHISNQQSISDNNQTIKNNEIEAYSPLKNSEKLSVTFMPEELPLALLARNCSINHFNLLQGEFKSKELHSKALVSWLWVAGIAICALLLNVGYKGVELLQLNAKIESTDKRIVQVYKKAFPRVKRVKTATIKSQLKQKLEKLGVSNTEDGFLAMLLKVQPAFAKVAELKPDSLKFDSKRQELRLQAIASDYSHFDLFKRALENANLAVKQGAQNNQGDRISGSFSITNSKQKVSRKTNSRGRS